MAHYFTQESTTPDRHFSITGNLAGYRHRIQSATGLFSAKSFDLGTRLLCKHLQPEYRKSLKKNTDQTLSVLDFGCGYGVVSCFLLTEYSLHTHGTLHLDACDISPLALDLCRINIKESNHTRVILSDVLTDKYFQNKKYDYIITNPPFSAGKAVVQEFIKQSYSHLKDGGQFRCVAPTQR